MIYTFGALLRSYYEQTTNTTKSLKRNKNLFKNFTVKNNFNSIFCRLYFNENNKNNA